MSDEQENWREGLQESPWVGCQEDVKGKVLRPSSCHGWLCPMACPPRPSSASSFLEGSCVAYKLRNRPHNAGLIPGSTTYLLCCCCCSVAHLCQALCDPIDCGTPGFPVLHHIMTSLSFGYVISSKLTPHASVSLWG